MPLHIHSPRHIPFRQHTCVRHCRCACMWTTHVVCICIGQKLGHFPPPHVFVNGAMCTTLQVFPLVGIVMVSWCQRQVPPPAGGSCPRSRPGQSGTAASATPCATLREPPPPFPALSLSTPHGMGSYRADHAGGTPCRSLWTQGPQCIQFCQK